MQRFRRTFEDEKHQLQELNDRLAQYLCRTQQLEDENALLITEINTLHQAKTAELERGPCREMRELRMLVGRLSSEKSRAEMERERLLREVRVVVSLRRGESQACHDIGGELRGCEEELRRANESHVSLEQRVVQLQGEYEHLEETHRRETAQLRRQLDSQVAVPWIITPSSSSSSHQAASVEEVQRYARCVSEGWTETLETYQHHVEDMERSIQADRAMLDDLQQEKMLYAAEFDKLRGEAHQQSEVQARLEEQLGHMQDRFQLEISEYQRVIGELEQERNMLADNIAAKLWDHQQLLQVKMDLGMEMAAYRSLLEGGGVNLPETHRMGNQRDRIIDIKMPSQPYSPRPAPSSRPHLDVRYMELASTLRGSPGSISPSRVIPISVSARHQSPASRRDMLSFNKARAEGSTASTASKASTASTASMASTASTVAATRSTPAAKDDQRSSQAVGKEACEEEEEVVRIKPVTRVENKVSPVVLNTEAPKSEIRTVLPPLVSREVTTEVETKKIIRNETEERVLVRASEGDNEGKREKGRTSDSSEKRILDSATMEDIISKVMQPAGVDTTGISAGDSPITYHVEKTEQEDGSIKTQIILESKVEEEVDISQDSALDALLSGGVTTISLEDIKGTPTGSMIQELLSGLQGEQGLANKSVNVQIMEQALESHSDEYEEFEQGADAKYPQPSSVTYCQIEEVESATRDVKETPQDDYRTTNISEMDMEHSKVEFVHVDELSRSPKEPEAPYYGREEGSQEYFVSTPDENLSELNEGGGITSYGHYGNLDDLTDERYYQDEELPQRGIAEELDEYELSKFMSDDDSYAKEHLPECIIEEEVQVSPTVQESVLRFLKEDSMDPKEQLEGALDRIQDSVSGPLREELAYFTRLSRESPQNMSVDIKRVQHTNDDGTTTIVAELSLTESGLLEDEEFDLSEEHILASLQSSNPGFGALFQQGGAQGYSFKISEEQETVHSTGGLDDITATGGVVTETTEKYIKLGPTERSFTFQKDHHDQTGSGQALQSHTLTSPIEVSHEKKVATVYLESSADD